MHHPTGFPSRLVRLRADAGMTQRDLAKASGISLPQIGRYEMGTSKPRMTALVKLAGALGCDVSDLEDAADESAVTEITLVTNGYPDTPIAIPSEMYEQMLAQAESYGISPDIMLASVMRWYIQLRKGDDVPFEEIVKTTIEMFDEDSGS
ncbi:helix-turn-helix transcriptional regulator [Pseudomonas sp.]|uniref:helix-turn-helix domain-containing protein n=1 Tax=Pseudomonas sp. TaxID=306 RepID=UPI0028986105|nr:helix-turn-helix transcriptional regulator [Pseudomonas sp.]